MNGTLKRAGTLSTKAEPQLTLDEVCYIRRTLYVELARLNAVPNDYWTSDMHLMESARNRLWRREFVADDKKDDEGNRLTKDEWKTVCLAVEVELRRYKDVPRERWTSGLLILKSAYDKMVGVLYPQKR